MIEHCLDAIEHIDLTKEEESVQEVQIASTKRLELCGKVIDLTTPSDLGWDESRGKKCRIKISYSVGLEECLEDSRLKSTKKKPKRIESSSKVFKVPESDERVSIRCPVCLEYISEEPFSTICGHVYCRECVLVIMKKSKQCAVCRSSLKRKGSVHRLYY